MIQPTILTAATARRIGMPERPPMPKTTEEVRKLVIRPIVLALMAARETKNLRYEMFDGRNRFVKESRVLNSAVHELEHELIYNQPFADQRPLRFVEFAFYSELSEILFKLRLQIDQLLKFQSPTSPDIAINAQAEIVRFLARLAIEDNENAETELSAVEHGNKLTQSAKAALDSIQRMCLKIEGIIRAPQIREVSASRIAVLETALMAFINRLKTTPLVHPDKCSCCGVCANFKFDDRDGGRCKWPTFKGTRLRSACKRFKRMGGGE